MNHLKEVLWIVLAAVLFLAYQAFGAEAPYVFSTLDIVVPGHPGAVVWLKDVSKNHVLAMTFWTDSAGQPVWGSLLGKLNDRRNKLTQAELFFDCSGLALNDSRQVVGNDPNGACVRQPNGNVISLVGVPQNQAFGISTDGRVSGSYCVPNGPPNFGCTIHGFTWKDGVYTTIDLTEPAGVKVFNIVPLAPNKSGQVLIGYALSTPVNEIFEDCFTIWDNGSFSPPFACSFAWGGGENFFTRDFNDLGQIVFLFNPNDGTPARLELYDDGVFSGITGMPAAWQVTGVEGESNEGDFVGAYNIQIGIDPFYGTPIFKRHNFVASPIQAQLAKNK